jgi:hypothetical protein
MKLDVKKIVDRAKEELVKEFLYVLTASRRGHKILFDHLPKCGGSSLNKYLEAHYPRRKIFSLNTYALPSSLENFRKLSQKKRYGYDLVKGHMAHKLLDHVHPECIKVTVLREPVDRIVSHYYYAKGSPSHYLYSHIHSNQMSLVDYANSNLSAELRNWYTVHYSGLTSQEAERNPRESIDKACETVLTRYNIIGFLDDFSFFADTLRKQANFRYAYTNTKINVSEGRPRVENLEASIIDKIKQINYLDIELYKKIKSAIINNEINNVSKENTTGSKY